MGVLGCPCESELGDGTSKLLLGKRSQFLDLLDLGQTADIEMNISTQQQRS